MIPKFAIEQTATTASIVAVAASRITSSGRPSGSDTLFDTLRRTHDRVTAALPNFSNGEVMVLFSSRLLSAASASARCKWLASSTLVVASMLGCANGPLGEDKWVNPFEAVDTSYKAAYGLTPAEVAKEVRALADKVPDMSPDEQEKGAIELTARYEAEKDPILRRQMIYALGAFPDPFALAGLHAALQDTDRFVRAEACRAWGRRASDEAMQALATTIQVDESVDVRQVAISSMKRFQSPEAIRVLGDVLNERDPALQYLAMQSLKQASGKDLGNDARKWDDFIASNYPRESGNDSMSLGGTMVAELPDTDSWR